MRSRKKGNIMKIFILTIILCLLCIASSTVAGILLWSSERGEISLGNDNYMEEMAYTPSKGVLSTGIMYEFRGNYDFNEFREQNNFYLERATNTTVKAQTPIEAVELGQFFCFQLCVADNSRANMWKENLQSLYFIIVTKQIIGYYR
jgi:hypothetical protein